MAAVDPYEEPPIRRAWLVTFVDLLCLLLAFFVMMSAMQKMDASHWAGIAGSLSRSLDPDHTAWNARPRAERNADVAVSRAASDLAYLEAVLAERARGNAALAGVSFRLGDDRLSIVLPEKQSTETIAALATLLGNFGNAVAVRAHGGDGRVAAMQRATALAAALREAGYTRDLPASELAGPRRVELVVLTGRYAP